MRSRCSRSAGNPTLILAARNIRVPPAISTSTKTRANSPVCFGSAAAPARRVVQMASLPEFVLGQLDHVQNVVGMFPERESFVDEVNAIDGEATKVVTE